MRDFVHMKMAYILRWNKPDYKVVIGVFGLREHLEDWFMQHFTPAEFLSDDFKIETAPYYEPRR